MIRQTRSSKKGYAGGGTEDHPSLIVRGGALAYLKQKTGREMGSEALKADAAETCMCSYLSLALLLGVGLYAAFG